MKMISNKHESRPLARVVGNSRIIRPFHPTRVLLPALSKSNLHNYFADKMAVFSILIGFISERSGNSGLDTPFNRLYKKLVRMRASFLVKYNKLSRRAGNGKSEKTEGVKLVFNHIYQFEKNVVSEILKAGLQPQEIMDFNKRQLRLASK